MDIYVENGIPVSPDISNNTSRGNAAMPLSVYAISRPLAQKELVPRDEMIDPSKAKYEGH